MGDRAQGDDAAAGRRPGRPRLGGVGGRRRTPSRGRRVRRRGRRPGRGGPRRHGRGRGWGGSSVKRRCLKRPERPSF
ncbi:hypothetical protein AF335_07340 [Streptomyces eurocidicus]|uniref:Uncharacterized protein n=1 Tax=Streptomyces eurocidicus TaxID=66423 RepID=A0A2N8P054_STREU|nr:hypothetical protein AF335_07340 [Streptomyces eurocidicus]